MANTASQQQSAVSGQPSAVSSQKNNHFSSGNRHSCESGNPVSPDTDLDSRFRGNDEKEHASRRLS